MYEIPEEMLVPRKKAMTLMTQEAKHNQDIVHNAVGRLIAVWANVESIMIHLAGRLLGVSDDVAFVTYYSFTGMRARQSYLLVLIENTMAQADRQRATRLITTFNSLSAVRNELVHAEYVINPTTYAYEGSAYSQVNNKTRKLTVSKKPFDTKRIKAIGLTGDQLQDLGQDVLTLCRELDDRRKHPSNPPK